MRTNYKRISNIISNNFSCELDKPRIPGVLAIFEGDQRIIIQLVDGNDNRDLQGIHLSKLSKDNLEHYLVDAIQTALKDNFSRIYIHQSRKPSAERLARRQQTVKGWLAEFEKKPSSSYYLNKLDIDAEETLASMSEEQIDFVLALICATSTRAHELQREWNKRYQQDESKAGA